MPITNFSLLIYTFIGCLLFIMSVGGQAQTIDGQSLQNQERIIRFDSQIEVRPDGTIEVHETIVVWSERQQIRRGIFRDFKRVIETEESNLPVRYSMISVEHNGTPSPYHIVRNDYALRLYIGRESSLIPKGEHRYDIRYTVDQQIVFGEESDELVWNVTGNFWRFPIEAASAKITLPEPGAIQDMEFFTGKLGAIEQNGTLNIKSDRKEASVTSTQALNEQEGLTIRVLLNKNIVSKPSWFQYLVWFLRDNAVSILSIVSVIVVFLYYFVVWSRIGRDPPKGAIAPRWDPPDNISPAMVHYIHYQGLQNNPFEVLSAALVNLAVKGYLLLEGLDKTLTLKRTEKTIKDHLPSGENAILKTLSTPGEKLALTKDNGTRLKSMVSRFRNAIEGEHRNMFFRENSQYCIGGIVLSALSLVGILFLSGQFNEKMFVLLAGAGFFTFIFGTLIFRILKMFKSRRGFNWMAALIFLPIIIIVVPQSSLFFYIAEKLQIADPVPLIALGILVTINILFAKIMAAPTPLGRKVMDHIEGLRHYLKLAESDRMNLKGAPQISPQHFETLLPYAIALKLEEPWSNTFDQWLQRATAEQLTNMQRIRWASMRHGRMRHFGRQMNQLSQSLQSSMRTAMPLPKSTSRIGSSIGGRSFRGFSGGGGGGLGGGGW